MNNITRRKFLEKTALVGAGMIVSQALMPATTQAASSGKEAQGLLLVPPFLGKPTPTSIAVNIVAGKHRITCYLKYRPVGMSGNDSWRRTKEFSVGAVSPAEITLKSLSQESRHQYQLFARPTESSEFQLITEETFLTQRSQPSPFSFAMFSDSHITPFNEERFKVLARVGASILARRPDFSFMLGDNIQTFTSHGGPVTEKKFGPILYANLRHGLAALPSTVPVFNVIGNWEGENGWHPEKKRAWAREARQAFIPTPGADTYPQGGHVDQNYYGFTWGDVLCLALNVTRYTTSDHAIQSPIGRADDWTLGEEQKKWLFEQLSRSKAQWKLLFIHHTVSGNAGDDVNSRYGRGGGRAAKVGEQALVHQWMRKFGVQALFYGHDHVFTDIPVDGIHYVCVGSAGAPWKFPQAVTGYKTYWTPFGYTWVDVKKDKLTVSFVKSDDPDPKGTVLHSFEIT